MIQLLIIADDFTGALDTGVQFSKAGISTFVTMVHEIDFSSLPQEAQVLVVDTESRHLPPIEAASIVHRLATAALLQGVPYLYKKTDSTLRGNIGAEIGALMEAAGGPVVFVPAYPKAGRTTVNGRQYVKGVPLEQTAFADDPLNPISTSDIAEILHAQTECAVIGMKPDHFKSFDAHNSIYLVDGETEEDLASICLRLKLQDKLRLTAGCAGFAAYLAMLLPLEHQKNEARSLPQNMLVVSGSVHEQSLKQLECAERLGFEMFSPSQGFLLDAKKWDTPEGERIILRLAENLDQYGKLVIRSTQPGRLRLSPQWSEAIAQSMGRLTYGILQTCKPCMLVVFGGDTAMGIMDAAGCHGIMPVDEIEPGVPISLMHSRLGQTHLVSKAGGLGTGSVLDNIIAYCGRNRS